MPVFYREQILEYSFWYFVNYYKSYTPYYGKKVTIAVLRLRIIGINKISDKAVFTAPIVSNLEYI